MSKPVIKFTHRYLKLGVLGNRVGSDYVATLVAVTKVKLQELPDVFLAWDTDNGRYSLPKTGTYLMLLFHSDGGIFTTLRAAWPSAKEKYYRSKIGQEFIVDFNAPDPNIQPC